CRSRALVALYVGLGDPYRGLAFAAVVHIRDSFYWLFFFNDTAPPEIYTLSLHDALPISAIPRPDRGGGAHRPAAGEQRGPRGDRSEEHTSELQSRFDLVCRLLLEKKKRKRNSPQTG